MRVVVLGAGTQGIACAHVLDKNPRIQSLTLVDQSLERAQHAARQIAPNTIATKQLNLEEIETLIQFLKPYDIAVSTVPALLNLDLTRAAIAAHTHWVDFGGNAEILQQQHTLDTAAKQASVTVLPDIRLPQVAHLLASYGKQQMDRVEALHIETFTIDETAPNAQYTELFARIEIIGEKACAHLRVTYELIGSAKIPEIITLPACITTQMLVEGTILTHGVLSLEQAVPTRPFLDALGQRNIRIRMDTVPLQETHAHHE